MKLFWVWLLVIVMADVAECRWVPPSGTSPLNSDPGGWHALQRQGLNYENYLNQQSSLDQAIAERNNEDRQIILAKLAEFDRNILTTSNVLEAAKINSRDKTNTMAALLNHTLKKTLAVDPWRSIDGNVVLVNSDSHFEHKYGRISQTTKDGILLDELLDQTVFILNYPYRYPDNTEIDFLAVLQAPYSYQSALGVTSSLLK